MNRRQFLLNVAASPAVAGAVFGGGSAMAADNEGQPAAPPRAGAAARRGRVNQSVCQWCFKGMSVAQLAAAAAPLGIKGIDLVDPKQWDDLRRHDLTCTMTPTHSINKGLNRRENHAECVERIRAAVDATADAGFPSVICFSGNRAGLDDDEGLRACAEGLKLVVGHAERRRVTVCMELLNSKVNHADYMCDRTAWGAALVDAVGSDRFKLLYDIYHMQVQEGDVIATIRRFKDRIGHYHTAGVPGRNELDDAQELNYPAIMRAIVDTGFTGFVGQEFIPTRDPLASLAEAVAVCDV